jgi:hypothetical protein
MSIKIDIDDLPGSVGKFTMAQLAKCYLKLNKNKQILSIQIKENHLPLDCAKIMTWNFWNAYGNVAGVSDVKRSTVRMLIYSRTNKTSRHGESARESALQLKNASLIRRAEQDLDELNQSLEEADDETDIGTIESQIAVKTRLIATLRGDEELESSGTMLDPSQIGAIGRRVFEILKKGDASSDAPLLKSEFEFLHTGVRPGRKDQHKFKAGGKTRIYQSDGSWRHRDKSKSKSKSGSRDRPKRFSSKRAAQPKSGSSGGYVPPHLRNGAKKFDDNGGEKKGGSTYVPPHLREGAKKFKDAKGEEETPSGKYVPPALRKKNLERNQDNGEGDRYISLDKIEEDSGPAFNTDSMMDFPELGAAKPKKAIEATKTTKTARPKKIDTSNVFSNLADMDWEHSESSDSTDPEPPKTSAWGGGTSFADIVKQAPKEVSDTEADDGNEDANDESSDWDEWDMEVKDKKVLAKRKLKLINSGGDPANTSQMRDLNIRPSIHPSVRPPTVPVPRSTIEQNNWEDESWDEEGADWQVESSWDRNAGYHNSWTNVGSRPMVGGTGGTGDKTYDSFFQDKPSYVGGGTPYDCGEDDYYDDDDYW